MPLNISKIGKVLKEINRLNITEFNASLPVKIEVKKEINPIRYLIQLGKKEVETKSSFPLIVGKKYFAQIKESGSKLQISNLREIPPLLEKLNKIELKEKLIHFSKDTTLKHLANASSKEEFIFFTNILLALEHKIHHLIINDRKKAVLQYKYHKNRVKFYAVFNHLGDLEGEITPTSLTIHSPYDATLRLIKEYSDELDLEVYLLKKEPKALFTFSENLLNLKA